MRYLLGVSGGIDSVVLLDMLALKGDNELIIAHFDHGIRSDSMSDARFVRALAEKYHAPFVMKREELGVGASEELARIRRYNFLRVEAKRHNAVIATAHHADDIIETIAINLIRGTRWRGVAVLDDPSIKRPLLHLTKEEIRVYATTKRLEWVEDSTNSEMYYLRNRVRKRLARHFSVDDTQTLLELWKRQLAIKEKIKREDEVLIRPDHTYSRYFFTHVDHLAAVELCRAIVVAANGASPMHPQIERALLAIKTARAGSTFELGGGVRLYFTARTFVVQTP